uniref:Ribosomal eL28/Mak16 domain-containing protein n=1 Tax=Aegilops tauschii subsp. strangulata TaxID=200361 RepID=A0A453DJD6_AEGTS
MTPRTPRMPSNKAKGNDYRSRVSGLGAREEQLLLDKTVRQQQCQGLANSKTVAVQPSAGEDKAVVLSTTKTKKQNTPAKLQHKTLMHKEFRKMAKSVKNQVLTPEFCT